MRSRPKVRLLLSPSLVTPGTKLLAETVLLARSKTPIDFVSMTMSCNLFIATGRAKSRAEHSSSIFQREWRSDAATLAPGEHRYRVAFDLPQNLPPRTPAPMHASITPCGCTSRSRGGPIASRRSRCPLPGRRRRRHAPSPSQRRARGRAGPSPSWRSPWRRRASRRADVLAGSVSIQNLRGKNVRDIELAFVEVEEVPASPDDPALSPAARAVWRDLLGRKHAVRIEPNAVLVDLEGKLADPNEALPTVELAVSLRCALAGIQGAGPFR